MDEKQRRAGDSRGDGCQAPDWAEKKGNEMGAGAKKLRQAG